MDQVQRHFGAHTTLRSGHVLSRRGSDSASGSVLSMKQGKTLNVFVLFIPRHRHLLHTIRAAECIQLGWISFRTRRGARDISFTGRPFTRFHHRFSPQIQLQKIQKKIPYFFPMSLNDEETTALLGSVVITAEEHGEKSSIDEVNSCSRHPLPKNVRSQHAALISSAPPRKSLSALVVFTFLATECDVKSIALIQ